MFAFQTILVPGVALEWTGMNWQRSLGRANETKVIFVFVSLCIWTVKIWDNLVEITQLCKVCLYMKIHIYVYLYLYLKSHFLDWIGGDRAVVQMRRRRWMLRRLQTWRTSLSWTRIVLTKIVDNECGGLRSCGQKSFASMSVHTHENPIQDPFDQLHLGHHWVCDSWKMFTSGFLGFPNSEHSHSLLANSPSINLRLSSKLEVYSMTCTSKSRHIWSQQMKEIYYMISWLILSRATFLTRDKVIGCGFIMRLSTNQYGKLNCVKGL